MTGPNHRADGSPFPLDLWADSFHEGQWACDQLGAVAVRLGGMHQVSFGNGYQPVHVIKHDDWAVEVTVYGSYDAWEPVPGPVKQLIGWGKPDLVAYDPATDRIIFAVEESAATPTGNQALQRCERQFGAAHEGVPFWYLLSEFGMHVDGNVRRDSIYPTIMALKISQDRGLPSVVLHYSDLANPEDYSAGGGLKALFDGLHQAISNAAQGKATLEGMADPLEDQYQNMLDFLERQWPNQIDFLPGEPAMKNVDLARQYALAAVGSAEAEDTLWDAKFLRWPSSDDLPQAARELQMRRDLIKHDLLADALEADVAAGHAYGLSSRTGSRPQPSDSITTWLGQQRRAFDAQPVLTPPASFDLELDDFPLSPSGLRHLTTSRRITFLYDSWDRLSETLVQTFPRLQQLLPDFEDDPPVFVYVSNSLKPGRIFGDPFTGQIAALATAFGKWDEKPRRVVTYFPHQTHAQAVAGAARTHNKGITIIRELVDLAVFAGGVGYVPSTGAVL
ncbi:MAG: hypothetical protein ACRDWY_08995 [Actinomycetes bacterium]